MFCTFAFIILMKTIRLLLIITSFAFPLLARAQNCSCTDCPLPIPAFTTITSSIDISGATINNLNNPNQGVCAVLLNFTSNQVMGLEMTLTSPAGQSVTLVGQSFATNQFTGGADWNVVFVPCGFPAVPDPGFNATWNNNQSWQLGGNYAGSYYPNTGCLENFIAGTVNGTWTLTIENVSDFYTGTLFNWTPVFCDNQGIDCYLCEADAGDLSSYPDIFSCQGSPVLDLNIPPVYGGTAPDTVNYGYTYIISQNGIIQGYNPAADLSSLGPGTYQVCGLSYLEPDIIYLPAPGTATVNFLRDTLNNASPPFCGDVSANCIEVTIYPDVINVAIQDTICAGECIFFNNINQCVGGVFSDTLVSVSGCDSIITLSLTVLPVPVTNLAPTICEGESFSAGGNVYTLPGMYNDTLQAANGCDSILNITLTVLDTFFTNISATICQGDTVFAGNQHFTLTGIYNVLLSATNTCDSTVRLNLTVINNVVQNINSIVCAGDTVHIGNSAYFTTGIYHDTLISATGCDSIINLSLTVSDSILVNISRSICQGDTIAIGSDQFTVAGNYTVNLTSQSGCDSVVQLTLNVLLPSAFILTDTICAGDSLVVGGTVYQTAGVFNNVLTGANGCDSTVSITLTVLNPVRDTLDFMICTGDTLHIGTHHYTTSGTYIDTLAATVTGCDSILVSHLVVSASLLTVLTETICDGEVFMVGSSVYATTGTYSDTLTSIALGCDSIVQLNLTVSPVFFNQLQATICQGESVILNNVTYTMSGIYTDTLTSQQQCDSIVQLNLTVLNPVSITLNETICQGSVFTVGSNNYFDSGNYIDTLVTFAGCDSIVNLTLTVFDSVVVNLTDTICNGFSIDIGTDTYGTSGYYTTTLVSASGCDSIVHLNLTVLETDTLIFAFICTGTAFQVGDSSYTQTGQYVDTLISSFGCDSIVSLFLLVDTSIIVVTERTICEGEFLVVGDSVFTQSGNYLYTFTSSTGCDSVIDLTLTVLPIKFTNIDTTLCEGGFIQIGNNTYIATGTYQDTLNTFEGCDSIIISNVLILPVILTSSDITVCAGETYTFGGNVYTASGIYYDTLSAISGCDSIIMLQLEVLPAISSYSEEIICEGGSFTVGDSIFTISGLYQVPFIAASGCDSLATLDLSVFPNLELSFDIGICDGGSYNLGGEILTIPGIYQDTLSTFWGCDSIVQINLFYVQEIVNDLSVTLCAGDSIQVGDSILFQTTYYIDTLPAIGGCDSIIRLDLTVIDPLFAYFSPVICTGDTFWIGNTGYSTTGTYTDTLLSTFGCDSIVTLDLTVTPFFEIFLTGSICEGYSYPVGDTSFSVTGIHQLVLPSGTGCDSIITLDLQVNPNYFVPLNSIICSGDTVTIGTTPYFSSGIYQQLLVSTAGCDSLVLLQLTVADTIVNQLTGTICAGQFFQVGDSLYSQTGDYQNILSSQNGCDSIVNLNLTVVDQYDIFLNLQICTGEVVQIGDSVYTLTGNYVQLLTTTTGNCDSIIHLSLQVVDTLETFLDSTICSGDAVVIGSNTYMDPGNYQVAFSSSSGCDSMVYLALQVLPVYDLVVHDTICEGESVIIGDSAFNTTGNYTIPLLTGAGCDSVIQLFLIVALPDTIYQNDTLCTGEVLMVGDSVYSVTGLYTNILINRWGCDSTIISDLTVRACSYMATLDYTGNPCEIIADGIITISASGGQPPYSYILESDINSLLLSGTITTDNLPVIINGMLPGDYHLTITDAFGIMATDTLFTGIPTPVIADVTDVSNHGGFMVSCYNSSDGAATATATGGQSPYQFFWDNGPENPLLVNAPPGLHQLVVMDQQGCSDTLEINFTSPPPLEIAYEIRPPKCFGDRNGRLIITEVSSGVAPYTFAFDSDFFTDVQSYKYLEAGVHTLIIRDAAGCEWVETINIPAPEVMEVSLGNDQFIFSGDSVHIEAMINLPGTLRQIIWSPQAPCDDCTDFWQEITEDIVYQATVIDTNNCFHSDQIRIWVQNEYPVFIPSIFSPNGDGINDLAMIFGGNEIVVVTNFRIFDRFGEMVFEAELFYPDDPSKGWDGVHKGEPMNPQVFVYVAEVKMKNRKLVVFKGDITLIR